MSEHSGPRTLSLALHTMVGAAVTSGHADRVLLSLVRPDHEETERRVVPFPGPRRPLDDGPSAA